MRCQRSASTTAIQRLAAGGPGLHRLPPGREKPGSYSGPSGPAGDRLRWDPRLGRRRSPAINAPQPTPPSKECAMPRSRRRRPRNAVAGRAPYRRFFAGDSARAGIAVGAQINHSGVLLGTHPAPGAVASRERVGSSAERAWVSVDFPWGSDSERGWKQGLGPLPSRWLSPGVAHVSFVLVPAAVLAFDAGRQRWAREPAWREPSASSGRRRPGTRPPASLSRS